VREEGKRKYFITILCSRSTPWFEVFLRLVDGDDDAGFRDEVENFAENFQASGIDVYVSRRGFRRQPLFLFLFYCFFC
jgi:hypothetical protein